MQILQGNFVQKLHYPDKEYNVILGNVNFACSRLAFPVPSAGDLLLCPHNRRQKLDEFLDPKFYVK